ncbi:hypothetical protein [Mesorhizobium sp. M7A.F.Ca.MR.362.00.0.0]|uniref:hypothetical protein n=1 Tax=Mesorhizobium sp. M7A.F.Ca.MR.362.00.0.0 TaxID=2496779 RepID=UPI000FD58C01|nr:hypothetical protein [Mesorhizobium sp. M7A.F.Ca.MR.362.00.0.0]RUU80012.1 hypothetical protein EOC06_13960 [Mesorhizobium sp. M7A.F.Ca.MR.362.00.0.0]
MAYVPDALWMSTQSVGNGAYPRRFYYYDAAAESNATLIGASFFSDGVTKGMRVGDLLEVVQVGTPKYKIYQVASVSGAAATVAAPTAIT